jgi:dipeptidase
MLNHTCASFLFLVVLLVHSAHGCTNILVSKGASEDGSTQIAYNADSGSLFGSLGHYPASDHSPGSVRDIWDWDGSFYLGSIPEANHTYNVVGNANEHGLIIGETTFGGLPALAKQPGAVMDYGSLIWVTLQRAKTAAEAITLMDKLCQEHGYASDGESFSIADPNEVWLMELIGKGTYEKGAVWVASKVPEGYITSTANQCRTRTFKQDDPANVRFAADVFTFAQKHELYPASAPLADFSFADVYDPVNFIGARICEARVWSIFSAAMSTSSADTASSNNPMAPFLDYAQGFNLTNRMPLFVKPASKLSVNSTMELMRTHFEGTWFDSRGLPPSQHRPGDDIGAGPGNSPYRQFPYIWKHDNKSYLNERSVGVAFTAWTMIAQSRSWVPPPIAALTWFSPDDSSTAVRIPLYGGITKVPPSYADLHGQEPAAAVPYAVASDAYTMSMDSAFWIANLIANMAYGNRYREVYPLVQTEIHKHQRRFLDETAALDAKATAAYKIDPDSCVQLVTEYCVNTGEQMTRDWRNFWMFLFSRYRDMSTVLPPKLPVCTDGQKTRDCTARPIPVFDEHVSHYTDQWYGRIVSDPVNAKHYSVPESMTTDANALKHAEHKLMRMNKRRTPAAASSGLA